MTYNKKNIDSFDVKSTVPTNNGHDSAKVGLYDPKNEHDACGLGFIANFKGKKSHKIIQDGIKILENLEHRKHFEHYKLRNSKSR